MTALGTHRDSDELAPGPDTTYDLIIVNGDRIVFHDYYESPQHRLSTCVNLLTASDLLADQIDTPRATEIHQLHQEHVGQWAKAPDTVVNAIAKLCRRWNIQVYVSTTKKANTAPEVLYSVVTEYAPGQLVVEHFPTTEARRRSLAERAEQFFTAPGNVPTMVLEDDQRLAALLAAFLMPATVTLAESTRDGSEGVYKPSGHSLPVR